MDLRNRIGLYGSYFLSMASIGFILPYLPLYLHQEGLSESAIGFVWTAAALAGLLQFPLGVWSDRRRARKPFLLVALAVLTAATSLLHGASGVLALGVLAVLFAENGPCRAMVESLAGAEAVHLAAPSQVGAALGALRFWRPIGIMAVALLGGVLVDPHGWADSVLPGSLIDVIAAQHYTLGSILSLLVIVQGLAFVAALLIHDNERRAGGVNPLLLRNRGLTPPRSPKRAPLAGSSLVGVCGRDGAVPRGGGAGRCLSRPVRQARSRC